jgi:2-polyprenyl-3-methyl-5-hydroxy-6-metoxy-1,4-benzoquinol methylase
MSSSPAQIRDTSDFLIPDSAPEVIDSASGHAGCGVGLVTRPLAELGDTVTGVDNRPEVLAAFQRQAGTETVPTDVESLDLGHRFQVVALPRLT